ncbi:hypothetical protein ACO2WH_28190, partial [Escherichia coli]|uniref:hypothetical protein n=1 Tax=Escherichia coli TaxID=562 RepID=UPI003BFDE199
DNRDHFQGIRSTHSSQDQDNESKVCENAGQAELTSPEPQVLRLGGKFNPWEFPGSGWPGQKIIPPQ